MIRKDTILNSIRHAVCGIAIFLRYERNARIHLLATFLAIILGIFLDITRQEWGFIVIAIALVWGSELINTSIEKACDFFHPEFDQGIKLIKDLAAGSVFIFSLMSIILGFLVFLPPLIQKLSLVQLYK